MCQNTVCMVIGHRMSQSFVTLHEGENRSFKLLLGLICLLHIDTKNYSKQKLLILKIYLLQ